MTIPNNMLPLVEAIEKVTGQRINACTAIRWATDGRKGVKLKTWKLGGRRLTTPEAVVEFITTLTEISDTPTTKPPAKRTATQRKRAIEKAERDLAEPINKPKRKGN